MLEGNLFIFQLLFQFVDRCKHASICVVDLVSKKMGLVVTCLKLVEADVGPAVKVGNGCLSFRMLKRG